MENDELHLRYVLLYYFKKEKFETAINNIYDVYLDCARSFRAVKESFRLFRNGYFMLNNVPSSGQISEIDDDIIRDLVNDNPQITPENIVERLNAENSIAFCRLNELGYTSSFDMCILHVLTERNSIPCYHRQFFV